MKFRSASRNARLAALALMTAIRLTGRFAQENRLQPSDNFGCDGDQVEGSLVKKCSLCSA